MARELRDLFERELGAETPPPLGSVVQDAMRQGTRLRRRRHLTAAGGVAAGVVALILAATTLGPPGQAGPEVAAASATPAVCATPAPGGRYLHRGDSEVAIFLRRDVTAAQRDSVDAALRGSPLVRTAVFEGREQAYAKFKELWRDSPDLANEVQPGALPEAFRVELKDPATYDTFVAQLRALAGIEDIVRHSPCASPTRRGVR